MGSTDHYGVWTRYASWAHQWTDGNGVFDLGEHKSVVADGLICVHKGPPASSQHEVI